MKLSDQFGYKCKNTYIALVIFAASVFIWNIYLHSRGTNYVTTDPFNKIVFNWNWLENCCSWWPILHFIGFAILGFLFPQCWLLLFVAGIVWEIFEVIMNLIVRGTTVKAPMRVEGTVQYNDVWWAGSFKDILFNGAGIALGVVLNKIINKGQPIF